MKHIGNLTNPRIATLYAQVPPSRLEEFQTYRRTFPYTSIPFAGMTWPYLSGGHGDPPLLLLSGALAIPDISWTSIVSFAAQHRVIVPAYPPVMTMDQLVDGIAAVLLYEGIEQVDVMGGSYGGFVAQVFVRRYPQMTRSLILSHSLPPDAESGVRVRRIAYLIRWLPMSVVRLLLRRAFQSMLPEPSDASACLQAIFDELIRYTLRKQDVIGILERTVDYSLKTFTPLDLSDWPGKVLLLFGADDPATPPNVRQRLEGLYPGCQLHLFAGASHATAVTHQAEYYGVIEKFLAEPSA